MDMISLEAYDELFLHDVTSGRLWWRNLSITDEDRAHYTNPKYPAERVISVRNNQFAGELVGRTTNYGYRAAVITTRHTGFKRVNAPIHRIIWEIGNGEKIPQGLVVDHINGNKEDNRISNLRVLSRQENNRNKKSKTGLLRGVHYCKRSRKWVSKINFSKNFETYSEACNHQRELRKRHNLEHLYTSERAQGIE